ncbi:oligosaccharide flippase family protein [Ferrimonas senticii]|uniref:oligosaccharide flippase family protein n=1 Tax=Ferrimonas senticii TaxID=394566 RepID=UPI0003F9494D|nr:oligosaccharide flippase family protein [Ferrimonas senticii]
MNAALHYGIGCALQRGVGLLLLPLAANLLAPEQFGLLGWLTVLASALGLLAALGLAETAQRFSVEPARLGQLSKLALCWCGLWLLLTPITSLLALALGKSQAATPLALLWVNLGCSALLGLRLMLLRLAQDSAGYLRRIGCWSTLQLLLTAVALWLGDGSLLAMMAAGALASGSTLLLQWRWLQQAWGNAIGSGSALWQLLRYALPLCGCGFIGFVFVGYERLWLGQALSLAQFGPFSLMAQLALIPILLIEPYGLWWFPKRFVLAKQQCRQQLADGALFGVLLLLAACVVLLLILPPLVTQLLPSHLHDGLRWLPLLLSISLWRQLAALLSFGIYNQASGRLPLQLNLALALPTLALLPLALHWYGVLGLLLALLALTLLRTLLFYGVSQRCFHLPYRYPLLLPALLGSQWALLSDSIALQLLLLLMLSLQLLWLARPLFGQGQRQLAVVAK